MAPDMGAANGVQETSKVRANQQAAHDCNGKFIRSQREVYDSFLPVLRDKGFTVEKSGRRLARPVKVGEEVLTIKNGVIVAKVTVSKDDGSMVVRQESADNEQYVLSADNFARNYVTVGADIDSSDPHAEELRERGFRYYERQGQLLVYQVTLEDMAFFRGGEFEVPFLSMPQPLRVGDYLVTLCPDMKEIYASPPALIFSHGNKSDQRPLAKTQKEILAKSQKEMCRHFIPILKQHGTLVRKMGRRLARPARRGEEVLTIINNSVVSRRTIDDDDSMVIMQESVDRELYALSADKFKKNYALPGIEIDASDPNLAEARERGFKYYERTGQLLIYKVTEDDMKFVPEGQFDVSFSTIPQPLRTGDYLVTVHPEYKEVYMSRHATIYNDDGQLFQQTGVLSQEKFKARFLPIMREKGSIMSRAGRRLARPAKRGEEVLTIVDGEVLSKMVVLDDTSMVIQEESTDRELYVLDRRQFERSYEPTGMDIEDRGAEGEELRRRNFRYYEKVRGMVLIYRVTEDDLACIPQRKFKIPSTLTPQPLRAGDYLLTLEPEEDVIYLSRNADQIYFSQHNLEVHYVFSSPVDHTSLSVNLELEGLRTSGAVVRLTCATRENLVLLKKVWGSIAPAVLHVSCHTSVADGMDVPEIVLEDAHGAGFKVQANQFLDLVIGGGPAPEVAVISSCHSESIAAACLQRGVQRVVAVRQAETLLDKAARDFAFSFYGELRAHRSVEKAFAVALESMRASRDPGVPAEAWKLVLLPSGTSELNLGLGASILRRNSMMAAMRVGSAALEVEPHIAVRLPFGAGEAGHLGPLVYPRAAVPRSVISALSATEELVPQSRRKFIVSMIEAFSKFRVVKVKGPKALGKGHLAGVLAGFAALPGGRMFAGGVAVLSKATEDVVVPQERMCEIFLPILKSKGTVVRKGGTRLARPAKLDEEVLTVINGEVVAKVHVVDETSMVIMQESSDRELYVLSQEKFENNYEVPGKEISKQGQEYDVLAERGFKSYERKGQVLIYRATEEDVKHVPGGKFEVAFSSIPQPVKVGDYLVTGYPDSKEVYMSRNAEQIYSSQIVRSQFEMCSQFLPIIAKYGVPMRRTGAWLARPARIDEEISTIIKGEVVSETTVTDESSMVVRAESCDGEYYVLTEEEFALNYSFQGTVVQGDTEEAETLRTRGFKRYLRKGVVRVYKVTKEDMKFLPSGRFAGKHASAPPQMLREGDHLVADQMNPFEVYASRNAEQVFEEVSQDELVRTQAEMRDYFMPILKQRGQRMKRCGFHAARPARRGETIQTLIDGEVVAKAIASDDTSMVVRKETSDRELVLLSAECFARYYDEASKRPIEEDGAEFDALRARGFKYYKRSGMVLVLQVTDEDTRFVVCGQFQVPFSTIPQPLRAGDWLVTSLPSCERIFLNRNALQCYAPDYTLRRPIRAETLKPPLVTVVPEPPSRCDSDSCFVTRLRSCVERGRPTPRRSEESRRDSSGNSGVDTLSSEATLTPKLRTNKSSSASGDSSPPAMRHASCPNLSGSTSPAALDGRSDRGRRVRAELEEALTEAAVSQAALTARWYSLKSENALAMEREKAAKFKNAEVEAAMNAWMSGLPAGCKTLVVLVNGARFLAHQEPRELLRNLLRAHPGLHLLVTISTSGNLEEFEAAAAAELDASAPEVLDPQVMEHPNLVAVPPLTPPEAAEVFFMAMMRSQQGRPLGQLLARLGRVQSVAKLSCHPAVVGCRGLPGRVKRLAENLDSSVASLEDLATFVRDRPEEG